MKCLITIKNWVAHTCLLLVSCLLLNACASFDKTNIQPGQRVEGFGFSFEVPTETPWFAVVYGTSHRIKLRQLNSADSYSILVTLNHGPRRGMFPSAEDHLNALKRHLQSQEVPKGLIQHSHHEDIDKRYGELCVRHTTQSEDWRGRNSAGPALVDTITLSCPHPGFDNVLISTKIERRYETDASQVDLTPYADQLFGSFEFDSQE